MAQYDVVIKAVDQTKAAFRNVETGLKGIQTRTEQVNKTLATLGTGLTRAGAIATAALGAAATSALRYADSIQDASDATGIGTARILAFSQAVGQNGGDANKAVDGLLKFSQSIGEAANGSQSARDAFAAVGVSLSDLASKSEEDLLGQVVKNLAGVGNESQRAALQADVFGKSLKGTNIAGFGKDLDGLTEKQRANAAAIAASATLVDNLKGAYNRLELAVLKALKPFADQVNALSPAQIDKIVNSVLQLSVAIVGLTTGLKVIQGIAGVLGALGGATIAVGAAFKRLNGNVLTVTNLFKNFKMLLITPLVNGASVLARFTLGWLVLRGTIVAILAPLVAIGLGIAKIGLIAVGAALAIDALFDTKIISTFVDGVKSAYDWVKNLIGLGDKNAGAGRGVLGGPTAEELAKYQAQQAAIKKAQEDAAAASKRAIANIPLDNLVKSIAEARAEYNLFLPLLASTDAAIAAGALEKVNAAAKTLQLTLSDDIIIRNFNAALKEQAETLRQQNIIYGDSARVLGEFNLELAKQEAELRKSATVIGDNATQQRQFNLELEKSKQAQQQQAINLGLATAAYKDGKISLDDYLKTLQGVDATLLSAEQRQLQFNEAISKGMADTALNAQLAGQAMAEAFATGDMERYLQIYEQYKSVLGSTATGELATARKGAKEELDLMQKRTMALKTLTEEYKANGGVATAEFRKVADSLGMSTDAIDRMVNIHGSAIDRMVEDTKFYQTSIESAATTFSSEFTKAFMEGRNALDSFRNFFSNIANDIANRIIKQQLADPIADALSGIVGQVMGGLGGGGGGSSGAGGFLGTIVSGVGGFLGDIFGGFFADGGMLGAGQVGIVGEEGPEFITGPANITPFDKMQNNDGNLQVVFQIQAIDTQTGAQFLLQNKPLITSMITQAYNSRGRRGPLD
ncbi:hypothetical protein UFOVP642_26 [uncultured Caudovirales phage]|uniref:Bacteriophage lambda, GpH, tail tape measure, C-terminal n=1 Tax=uncultured Caudovirales phage TaxID=2100421 RepID=A0A6J5NB89_9CAUD|nr:hypothetical protein UFOVP642_26 [uncultured Caudovirales phage]